MRYIALLRGINVGGKAKLPMKELAAIFIAAGARDVVTYIQSGNVVFGSEQAETVVAQVTAEIARVYAYPGRIVLRSARNWLRYTEQIPSPAHRMRRCTCTSCTPGRVCGEGVGPCALARGQLRSARPRSLLTFTARHGADKAEQCLLRWQAENGKYRA